MACQLSSIHDRSEEAVATEVPNEADEESAEVQGPHVRTCETRQETRSSASLGLIYSGPDLLAKAPGQRTKKTLTSRIGMVRQPSATAVLTSLLMNVAFLICGRRSGALAVLVSLRFPDDDGDDDDDEDDVAVARCLGEVLIISTITQRCSPACWWHCP